MEPDSPPPPEDAPETPPTEPAPPPAAVLPAESPVELPLEPEPEGVSLCAVRVRDHREANPEEPRADPGGRPREGRAARGDYAPSVRWDFRAAGRGRCAVPQARSCASQHLRGGRHRDVQEPQAGRGMPRR